MKNEKLTGTPIAGHSLIERAARLYDFSAAAMAGPAATALSEPTVPAPTVDPAWRAAPAEGRHGTVDAAALREAGFILPDSAVSALAEEFRIIKRQLLLDADRVPHGRRILVASAQTGDGKTFCAVNLALSLAAEREIDVLLVDADFAKPTVLSTLGLEGGPGLIDALSDPAVDVEACVIRTDIPHLSVLPAGRQSNEATELLASDRTRAVLDLLAARHPKRVILFDSPPVLAASPAAVLAQHVGQTIVVVRADRTSEAELKEAVGLLDGCAHIQLLLNGVDLPGRASRYGSYYGHGG